MEERIIGEFTTLETRADANETVDRAKRYSQIIECLCEARKSNMSGLTAKEIAVMMQRKGYIPTSERNFVSPRLTELGHNGKVEPIGKARCTYTGKRVTVWRLRDDRVDKATQADHGE